MDDTQRSLPAEVDVAIVGAGIGGLATAVALRHAGIDAHVFERAEVLREIGGAVVIREPAEHLIRRWGLADGFHAQAVQVPFIDRRFADGTLEQTWPSDFTGDGQAYSVHRADLHGLLLSGVAGDRVHVGVASTDVADRGDHAVVRFDGGQVAARLVIGADGIRSVARSAVVQDERQDPLVFARLVVLRSLAPASALPAGLRNDRLQSWGMGDLMMLTLPLRAGTLVALDTAISADQPPADLWSSEVPTSILLQRFDGFDPRLLKLIEATTGPALAHPVYEREPIHTWSNGRITLLGDAAHPMAPRQGQGANQAILDADALAESLSGTSLDDRSAVETALARYEGLRVGPATAMQLASRTSPFPDDAPVAGSPAPGSRPRTPAVAVAPRNQS